MNDSPVTKKAANNDTPVNKLHNMQVNISHNLTKAAHSLSLIEKRIIALFLAKFDGTKSAKINNQTFGPHKRTIKITAEEYSQTFDIALTKSYQNLKSATDNFFERYVSLKHDDGKIRKIRWLDEITYHDREGWVEAKFSETITPHLIFNLHDTYTKYKLKATVGISSAYAWRFMELISQYYDPKKPKKGFRTISLEDFIFALDVPRSYKYSNIKQKVIEPAIKQVASSYNLKFTYTAIKKGRKVETLRFDFEPSTQIEMNLPE